MNITTKTITPELAKALLALNTKNRAKNINHVKHLAAEMAQGRWKLNGDPIRVSDGILIDGQHRLSACIQANVPFQTVFIEGLQSDVFDTIDCGKKRQAGDILHLAGEHNAALLAASLSVIDRHDTGRMKLNVRYSNTHIQELLKKYPDTRAAIAFTHNYRASKLLPPSWVVGMHYVMHRKNSEESIRYFEDVFIGAGIHDGSPAFLVRHRLLDNKISRRKHPHWVLAAVLVKGWNLRRSYSSAKRISISSDEDFPEII